MAIKKLYITYIFIISSASLDKSDFMLLVGNKQSCQNYEHLAFATTYGINSSYIFTHISSVNSTRARII